MSKWTDTSTIFEADDTFSQDVIDFEEPKNTFDLESYEKTAYEALEENINWKELKKQNLETPKIRVFDVAAYILEKKDTMTTMKLQKLVYYSQVWSLVWDEKPLFQENIEAWSNGPVVRELFDYHRGTYEISEMPIGNPRLLDQAQRNTVDAVLEYYGNRSAQWLIDLSHMEDPWVHARKGLPPLERSNRVIPLDAMAHYYSSLSVDEDLENE